MSSFSNDARKNEISKEQVLDILHIVCDGCLVLSFTSS